MSEQKGLGSKLLGIFVEAGDEKAPSGEEHRPEKSAAELVAELAGQAGVGPAAAAPLSPAVKVEKMAAATTANDFEKIFFEAGMDAAELDRVKKAEELLRGLPESTPQPVKKQIVEASLKAFGFEIDKIALAAQNQQRALDAYVKVNEASHLRASQDAEQQVRSYNEKIQAMRQDLEKRTGALAALVRAAQERKGQVQKVLDFFRPPPGSTP